MPFLKPNVIGTPGDDHFEHPTLERVRRQAVDFAERGVGAPGFLPVFYALKIVAWALLGLWISVATSDLGSMWVVSDWWAEPIVYQKLLLWAILWEALSLGAGSGPGSGHFFPLMSGVLHWTRPGTIRRPPFGGRIPMTGGWRRTPFDVAVYVAIIAGLIYGLVIPGRDTPELTAVLPDATGGMLPGWLMIALVAALLVLGLRDQVAFLATRPEQYMPALFFAAVLSPQDFLIAIKILIVVSWLGAAVSKFGHNFTYVIPPMMSNSPAMPSRRLNRLFYRDHPHDLRPSRLAWFFGHILGTVIELCAPLVLLLSGNYWAAVVAAVLLVGMHVVILSTVPLAVPMEWNVHFLFLIPFLFFGFPAWDGFAVTDLSSGWALALILAVLLPLPILGNFRPDLVSFLLSMRQYSGNWATSQWAFRPEALRRFYDEAPAGAGAQEDVLAKLYGRDVADRMLERWLAFRSMHTHGRGLLSATVRELGDELDDYTIREGELVSSWILGWNFGDGHFHNDGLAAAVQESLGFAPGDVIVVCAESQPIHRKTQRYKIVDLALGVIEEGTWNIEDTIATQPWLPDGPIPFTPDAKYRGRTTILGKTLQEDVPGPSHVGAPVTMARGFVADDSAGPAH